MFKFSRVFLAGLLFVGSRAEAEVVYPEWTMSQHLINTPLDVDMDVVNNQTTYSVNILYEVAGQFRINSNGEEEAQGFAEAWWDSNGELHLLYRVDGIPVLHIHTNPTGTTMPTHDFDINDGPEELAAASYELGIYFSAYSEGAVLRDAVLDYLDGL